MLERELLGFLVLGEALADLGDALAGPGPARRRGLLLGLVEEGDGLDVKAGGVVGLPPQLLHDNGAVGEVPPRAVPLEQLLHLGRRLVQLRPRLRRDELDQRGLRRRRRGGVALLGLGALLQQQDPRPRAVDAPARRLIVRRRRGDLRRGGLPVLEAERPLEDAGAGGHGLAVGGGGGELPGGEEPGGGGRPHRRRAGIPGAVWLRGGEEEASLCVEWPQSHRLLLEEDDDDDVYLLLFPSQLLCKIMDQKQ